jgi:nucleotide-binding universal stress UspA family protein
MKTILVPAAGSESDDAVFATALAAARPLGAHLEFLHVRLSASEAALAFPHVDFARGAALRAALQHVEADQERRAILAQRHVQQFCTEHDLPLREMPGRDGGASAAWHEAQGCGFERIMRHARRNDLVVLGRASRADGLPQDLVEIILLGSGRPVLLASQRPVKRVAGTTLVCWKETAEATHALAAAIPLLAKSDRVIVLAVAERKEAPESEEASVVRHLAWHGIAAEAHAMPWDGRAVSEKIDAVMNQYGVDLLVMGGYGHARTRELLFGGCTQRFLDHADRPVFLMH